MSPRGRSDRRRAAVLGLVLLVVAGLVAGVLVQRQRAEGRRLDASSQRAASAFAAAVAAGDLSPVRLTADPAGAQRDLTAITAGLGGVRPTVEVTGVRRADGEQGTADLRWSWPFGAQTWTYDTTLPLRRDEGPEWSAAWSPAVVHPGLVPGEVLQVERTPATRADVLGRGGAAVVSSTAVVEVGVQPSKAPDPAALARRLAELLDVEAAPLEQRLRTSPPDAFVPVIVLRRTEYEPLRDQLQPLPGTVFREGRRSLAPTRTFARGLLGTTGPVTAEVVEQSGGRLAAGDLAGLSGLQRRYDERLGGSPGFAVSEVSGQVSTPLFSSPPVQGTAVQLTLDPSVQTAADAALATATGGNGNASLVAVDVATGDLLAVANTPASGADRATGGRYPPGSTFKTVSTVVLLGTGLSADEQVQCPPTATVEGRSFRNFEGGALGTVPFRTAFAQSCNTAFVGLSDRLPPPALPAAATSLGLGVPWQVGVDVFAGDVPAPAAPVDRAASTIGQGKLLVSPAAMAQAVATIARGSWAPPRLVLDPAPTEAVPPPPAADPTALEAVRALMRQVVVDGTASALADVPGAPVHAKTGTAEFGTASPPQTHAWTVGFQGPIAFAVIVEEGASGGAVAVPVAEAFLRGLAG